MISNAVIREYKVINVLAICKKIKNLWHFEILHGSQWKILTCPISWKRLIVERNGGTFGIHRPMYCICRVLFISDSLSSVWRHSVHFAKFPMLGSSKGYCSQIFHFQPNFIARMLVMRKYRLLLFGDLPKIWNLC